MRIVYICSPLKGDIQQNIENALEYCRRVTFEGNVPVAPHAYFTSFLDDTVPHERKAGMKMGMELLKHADELHVFGDRISEGMQNEIIYAEENGIPVTYRPGMEQTAECRLINQPPQAVMQMQRGW